MRAEEVHFFDEAFLKACGIERGGSHAWSQLWSAHQQEKGPVGIGTALNQTVT
jgi:hypothetical protein